MLLDLFIHIGLGLVLGVLFAASALSKMKTDGQKAGTSVGARIAIYGQNILIVGVAFVALIFIMKFARDYQPRSWINLAALIVTWVATGLVCWRMVFIGKRAR